MVEPELPEDETTVVREVHVESAVEGWPTAEPPFDSASMDATQSLPVEDERLRVYPDGTVEHERVQRRFARVPGPFADFWPALALILLAALIGLGALWYFTRTEQKVVPTVSTLRVEQAVARLQDEGFKTEIVSQPNGAPPDIVFGQRPSAGTKSAEGSAVTILVSRGPANVSVPNAVGLLEKDARDRLAAAGLAVRVFQVPSDKTSGTVVAQDPGSGERVSKDASVRINVSKGRTTVEAPDLVGTTEQAARDRLVSLGLSARVARVFSDRPPGTVVAQDPSSGAKVSKDGSVRLNISKGTGLVDVPSVVGLSRSEAEATLANSGLRASVLKVPSDEPVGTVVAQSPSVGQRRKGSPVQINVSIGRP